MSVTNPSNSSISSIDLLLVAITTIEATAIIQHVTTKYGQTCPTRNVGNLSFRDLGTISGASTWLLLSGMSSEGVDGAQANISDAIQLVHPTNIVMVGIAYSFKDESKHPIGTILVSQQVHDYRTYKVTKTSTGNVEVIQRGDKTTASPNLVSRFRNSQLDWPHHKSKIKMGLILSGGTLVDDYEYRQGLLEQQPEAIGGEMEGAGLRDAASRYGANWILIKGVCDYGHDKQTPNKDEHQHLAATNAIEFVIHTIEQGGFGTENNLENLDGVDSNSSRFLDSQDRASAFPVGLEPKRKLIGREGEFSEILDTLDGSCRGVVICGLGGMGKTLLAEHISKYCFENNLFQTVLFISLKQVRFGLNQSASHFPTEGRRFKDVLNSLCSQTQNNDLLRRRDVTKISGLLDYFQRQSNASRKTLIAIDNIDTLSSSENAQLFDFIDQLPVFCNVIITSRPESQFSLTLHELNLKGLSQKKTSELLNELARTNVRLRKIVSRASAEDLKQFYSTIGGIPLCVYWSLGLIKTKAISISQLIQLIQDRPPDCTLEQYLFEGIVQSEQEKLILKALTYFPDNADQEDVETVACISEEADFQNALSRLVTHWIVETDGATYGLHPFAQRYARNLALDEPVNVDNLPHGLQILWSEFLEVHGFGKHVDADSQKEQYSDNKKNLLEIDSKWNNISPALDLIYDNVYNSNGELTGSYLAFWLIRMIDGLGAYLLFYGHWQKRIDWLECTYKIALDLDKLNSDNHYYDVNWADKAAWLTYDLLWTYKEGYLNEPSQLVKWLDIFEEAVNVNKDDHGIIEAIRMRGLVAEENGEFENALKLLNEAKARYETMKAPKSISNVLNDIGALEQKIGQLASARESLTAAYDMQVSCEHGTQECTSAICGNLGDVEFDDGNLATSQKWYQEQIDLGETSGRLSSVAIGLTGLARIAEVEGDPNKSLGFAQRALAISNDLCSKSGEEIPEHLLELMARLEQDSFPNETSNKPPS